MTKKTLKGKNYKIEISIKDGNDKEDKKNQTTKPRRTHSNKDSVSDKSVFEKSILDKLPNELHIDNSRDVYFVILNVEIDK